MKFSRIALTGFLLFPACVAPEMADRRGALQIPLNSLRHYLTKLTPAPAPEGVQLLTIIEESTVQLLAIVGLLSIWLFLRLHSISRQPKTRPQLNEEEDALLHLATETLTDLIHRVHSKPKILPFPPKEGSPLVPHT